MIDCRSAGRATDKCIVKDGGITRQYRARNLKAFGFKNGERFESNSFFDLARSKQITSVNKALKNHVFYDVLVKGSDTLYRYNNGFIYPQ